MNGRDLAFASLAGLAIAGVAHRAQRGSLSESWAIPRWSREGTRPEGYLYHVTSDGNFTLKQDHVPFHLPWHDGSPGIFLTDDPGFWYGWALRHGLAWSDLFIVIVDASRLGEEIFPWKGAYPEYFVHARHLSKLAVVDIVPAWRARDIPFGGRA